MEYIRQKSLVDGFLPEVNTVVNTSDWTLPLSEHPSVVEHPEIFEVVDGNLPATYQTLNYVSDTSTTTTTSTII